MKLKNPNGLKYGRFKWLDRQAYRDIGKLQFNLNKAERKMLISQLAISMNRYEKLALNLDAVRKHLYLVYNKMILSGLVTSQLSSEFNMSMKGHNDKVQEEIDKAFSQAYSYEQSGNKIEASRCLRLANLNHKILFSKEVISIVESESSEATIELVRIKQFRDKLFLSTIKMAVSIAHKYNAQLDGNTVEWLDLAQEAVIGAMQAVDAYRPIEDGKTFTSFVYRWVSGIVSKEVSEILRTVSLPRSLFDRYSYVQKAIEDLGLVVTDLRGGKEGLDQGKIDHHTLCQIANRANVIQKGGAPFSVEEVRVLLLTTQDEISLDKSNSNNVSYKSIIPDEALIASEQVDGALMSPRLLSILRDYLSNEEYDIMKLRYGSRKRVRGYHEVADMYIKQTGEPMNKGKVALIEKEVISILHDRLSEDPDFKSKLRDLMETTPFISEQ